MANKKQPEVRFEGFREEWEKTRLSEKLVSMQTGTNLLGSELIEGIPLIKMGNIQRGFFSLKKLEYIDKIISIDTEHIVNYGDFLFNTRNTLDLVGKGATWTKVSGQYAFNSNIARLKLDGIDTIFFNYLYNTNQSISQVRSRANGTTSVAAVYKRDLKSVVYYFPKLNEQQKVGTFFKQLDDRIAFCQRQLELLKEQKKGFLQKMFPKAGEKTPEVRFAGFTEEWEEKKLGEECDVRDGTHDSPKYFDFGYPLVTSKNLKDYGLNLSDVSFISENDFKVINKRSKVDVGDILFGMIGTVGNPVQINRDGFAIKNVALIKEKDKVLNNFLINVLKSPIFDRYLRNENAGGTQKFLSLTKVRMFKLLCPDTNEQQKIGIFFKQLDDIIALNQKELDLLKETKKGFLQKMFV